MFGIAKKTKQFLHDHVFAKEAVGTNTDRTVYGAASASASSFVVHHTQHRSPWRRWRATPAPPWLHPSRPDHVHVHVHVPVHVVPTIAVVGSLVMREVSLIFLSFFSSVTGRTPFSKQCLGGPPAARRFRGEAGSALLFALGSWRLLFFTLGWRPRPILSSEIRTPSSV